jgi:hypothetical protein
MEQKAGDAVSGYATERSKAAGELREKSLLAFLVERLFRGLQRCSPGSSLGGSATDSYIIAWLAVAAVLGTIAWCRYPALPRLLEWFLLVAAACRVTDITQAVVNLALFDRLGRPKDSPRNEQLVLDITRSLVLLLGNFFELVLWFGIAYLPLRFVQGSGSFWSRFYFSAVTQLTIGYGDLTPLGWGKAVAVVQGILGWTVTVVVIARFVGSLPSIRSVDDGVTVAARGTSRRR